MLNHTDQQLNGFPWMCFFHSSKYGLWDYYLARNIWIQFEGIFLVLIWNEIKFLHFQPQCQMNTSDSSFFTYMNENLRTVAKRAYCGWAIWTSMAQFISMFCTLITKANELDSHGQTDFWYSIKFASRTARM